MPRVSFASVEQAAIVASPACAKGAVETRALFNRDRDSIHLHVHRLTPGASVLFVGAPADCMIYIWEGSVEAGGAQLTPRSSAIAERGAALTVTALDGGATLLTFSMREPNEKARAGRNVHLLPSEYVPRVENAGGRRVRMALHADSQCPTCEVWLHENDFRDADDETAVHSHSEDELIFIRAGAIRFGRRLYGPGTAVAIAANTKYGFSSGPEGLSFVNFRGVSPTYVSADGTVVLDEAQLWHSTVGKPAYLAPTGDFHG